ncbi:MAG: lytic murein transglycosylase [Acidobacteriota bacterium]
MLIVRAMVVMSSVVAAGITVFAGARQQVPQTTPAPAGVSGTGAASTAAAAAPPTATAQLLTAPLVSFDDFLAGVAREALARGISQATIDLALTGLTPEPVVVTRDRAQPETTLSLDAYVARSLTRTLIATARREATRQASLLERVHGTYGVPPPVVMALWGIESNFGKFTGTYPTVRALATLAYDGRRPLFRDELFAALSIVDREQVAPDRLKGSWAGAMGQPQFMPSSFLTHAVDFDGDGRIDIWTTTADVFASMGNFLRNKGWQAGERWGREVAVGRAAMTRIDREIAMRTQGCRAERAMTVARPLAAWRALGVTLPSGVPLPAASIAASLVRGERRNFLVYENYEALLDYNCSSAYAITVGLLSDRIASP